MDFNGACWSPQVVIPAFFFTYRGRWQNTTYRTAGRTTEIQTAYMSITKHYIEDSRQNSLDSNRLHPRVPTALSVHTVYRYQLQLRW